MSLIKGVVYIFNDILIVPIVYKFKFVHLSNLGFLRRSVTATMTIRACFLNLDLVPAECL